MSHLKEKTMPVIEKNVPMPTIKPHPAWRHEFLDEMEVGDSVLIKAETFNLKNMRATIRKRNARAKEGGGLNKNTFIWMREDGYPSNDQSGAIRIWRIA